MSARRARWLFALGLAALLALFLLTFEQRSFEIPVGFQGEAAENPYLAAERMFGAMGVETRSIDGLGELVEDPPLDGVLILPTPRSTISAERSAGLRIWVERGGHLLVVAWSDWEEVGRAIDPLLDPLGVRQYVFKFDEEVEEAEAEAAIEPDYIALAKLEFPDRTEPLEVAFDPLFRLERPDGLTAWTASDANGIHLMRLELGKGLLTIATDDYFLNNDSIGEHDHAELAWRVALPDARSGPVWIVFNEAFPGAWALVWQHAWMIVLSVLVWGLVWIWQTSRRFGPLEPDLALERRRLMEHVEAAGRFQWRCGDESELLRGVRSTLMDRLGQRHPGWLALAPAELNTRLAELAGVSRARVARALSFRPGNERDTFAQNIATLERIRKSL